MTKGYVSMLDCVGISNVYLVDLYYMDGSVVSTHVLREGCSPLLLSKIAEYAGAVFAICSAKYGCRQFTAKYM